MRTIHYDTDEALIQALYAGEEEAFNSIYYRFDKALYHFARRFVSHEDADDTVTEAFVRLWEKRSDFDAIPKIERWLFVTVRNGCISVLRRQIRQHEANAELLHLIETADLSGFREDAITAELIELLHREIDKLPVKQRNVFLLSFREGLKPADIAERLSMSVQTIRNQKSSAIRLLQVALGQRAVLLALLVLLHEEGTKMIPAEII